MADSSVILHEQDKPLLKKKRSANIPLLTLKYVDMLWQKCQNSRFCCHFCPESVQTKGMSHSENALKGPTTELQSTSYWNDAEGKRHSSQGRGVNSRGRSVQQWLTVSKLINQLSTLHPEILYFTMLCSLVIISWAVVSVWLTSTMEVGGIVENWLWNKQRCLVFCW